MSSLKDFKFPSVVFQFLDSFMASAPIEEPVDNILDYLGVDKTSFRDPQFYLDGEHLLSMLKLLKKHSHNDIPSLKVLRHLSIRHMGMTGVAGLAALNLNEALNLALKFYKMLMPAIDIVHRNDNSGNRLEVKLLGDFEDCAPILMEIILGGLKQFSDEVTGEHLELRLEFSHPILKLDRAYVSLEKYQEYFQCEVKFDVGGAHSRLFLNEVPLDKRLKTPNKILYDAATSIIDKEFDEVINPASLSIKIRRLMNEAIEQEEPISLDNLAKQLHMTVRTLTRKLAKEGVQYKAILNEIRFGRAKAMLESRDLTLKQIASKLGFSNSDAFSRAFKSYTGVSPSQWINCRE